MGKPKIYISGPITAHGIDNAVKIFHECELHLKKTGKFEVINPAATMYKKIIMWKIPKNIPWLDAMKIVLPLMLSPGCNAICLLPGWTESRGAMAEAILALQLGYGMYNFFKFENKITIVRMR